MTTVTPHLVANETVELLKAIVRIPSVSGNEVKLADYLTRVLEGYFPKAVQRSGNNILVDLASGKPGPTLLLCSHIDTVSPANGWTRDPYGAEVDGDSIFGLGANDAGASVVSMIGAARRVGVPSAGRLLLCLAAEEEAGNAGFVAFEPTLPAYDAAIFGEPTNMGMASSMRGAMRAILKSHGVACHASRPWEGRNACDQFAKDLALLRSIDLKDESLWGGTTIEPTIVRAGTSTNQIPDLVETTLDIRTTALKDNDWVIKSLSDSGLDIAITMNRRKPMHNDESSALVASIRKNCPDIVDYTFNGTCDMAFARAASIVMGPGRSERSHAANEFIRVPELTAAVETYVAVVTAYLR